MMKRKPRAMGESILTKPFQASEWKVCVSES
ncbi:MAG: hypothetical protein ACLRWM_07235 [Streptococcus sp.]